MSIISYPYGGYDIIGTYKWDFVNRTNRVQFDYHHISSEMDRALEVIADIYPDYTKYAEDFLNDNKGYYCFCTIMKRDLLEDYFTWQFNILHELAKDNKWEQYAELRDLGLPEYEKVRQYREIRMPAFIMERLYNV